MAGETPAKRAHVERGNGEAAENDDDEWEVRYRLTGLDPFFCFSFAPCPVSLSYNWLPRLIFSYV